MLSEKHTHSVWQMGQKLLQFATLIKSNCSGFLLCSDLDSDEDDDDLDSYLGNRLGAGQRRSSYSTPRSDRVRVGATENGEQEWFNNNNNNNNVHFFVPFLYTR